MNFMKLLTDENLTSNEKIIVIYFYETGKGNPVTLSTKAISKDLKVSRVTIINVIKSLSDKGIIEKNNNSNIYDGTMPNTYKLKIKKYI